METVTMEAWKDRPRGVDPLVSGEYVPSHVIKYFPFLLNEAQSQLEAIHCLTPIDPRQRKVMTEDCKPLCTSDPSPTVVLPTSKDETISVSDKTIPRMSEDHTVVICEEVLKRREILLDMCNTRETEINRKRAEAWDEVHLATMNRCQRNLRLEQIKRVWRHQKNRVRHILNLEKLASDAEVTLEDVIAARKGFMTDYEIAIARAYLDVPPRSHSPGNRRLDELDLSLRKRAATSPSIRIDDSVTSVLDRIAAECAVEAHSQAQCELQGSSPMAEVKVEQTPSMDQSLRECSNLLEIQRLLNAMGPASSMEDKPTVKPDHAQRIAFEEQAEMYRSMRSFIEESTRTVRDLCGRVRSHQSPATDSSPSESNLEFAPNGQVV
ncbi:unnamed protein product [Haemonchus placei]|uniref:Regulatory protein zeste n=1 Tax=Haemonchus placei TaxID=6290 RepID=A0A0N4W3W0_HAEPC|nr:unnamed protein product [Haemonchus placei]